MFFRTGDERGWPEYRLKRIPPPDESDRAFIYDVMTQPTKEPA